MCERQDLWLLDNLLDREWHQAHSERVSGLRLLNFLKSVSLINAYLTICKADHTQAAIVGKLKTAGLRWHLLVNNLLDLERYSVNLNET